MKSFEFVMKVRHIRDDMRVEIKKDKTRKK